MKGKRIPVFHIALAILSAVSAAAALSGEASAADGVGGGYAVTGQLEGVGYAAELYDAGNGLPTSDANCILSTRDGYIWIGGYSGIIRYDGNSFERLDSSDGLTSGRVLLEDSKGRIWVGTNDNGTVVLDGDERRHFTYRDGLPSSSVRSIAESADGTIYLGMAIGVSYVGEDMVLHRLDTSGSTPGISTILFPTRTEGSSAPRGTATYSASRKARSSLSTAATNWASAACRRSLRTRKTATPYTSERTRTRSIAARSATISQSSGGSPCLRSPASAGSRAPAAGSGSARRRRRGIWTRPALFTAWTTCR